MKRPPQHIGEEDDLINTIAWCTGGAQSYMQYAIDAGIDAYLTGEINEPSVHNARETGTHFYAAGHHATERYGAKALGEHLAQEFGLPVEFVDIDHPV
ncbi:Nif3-like dinuclear metal center hexameric protein [Candidatus Halocynthiibacter alkanivorans]|uniref:Nif3-like dinuclear metal center hexameric protein n=1 Tax=Candidatus Halocynthiibacter alkanivorans TaxID=2267619 RepID=UPI00190F94B9